MRQISLRDVDYKRFIINAAIVFNTLWQAYNGVVHCRELVIIQQLIDSVKFRVEKHLAAWCDLKRTHHQLWKPQNPGWLKVNTDVAVRTNGSGIAMSCRDYYSSLCYVYME